MRLFASASQPSGRRSPRSTWSRDFYGGAGRGIFLEGGARGKRGVPTHPSRPTAVFLLAAVASREDPSVTFPL